MGDKLYFFVVIYIIDIGTCRLTEKRVFLHNRNFLCAAEKLKYYVELSKVRFPGDQLEQLEQEFKFYYQKDIFMDCDGNFFNEQ